MLRRLLRYVQFWSVLLFAAAVACIALDWLARRAP